MSSELTITTPEQANAAHRRIVGAVQDAIAIGEYLEREKAKRKHGQWLPWFDANIEFSQKTGDNYRKLYENRDKFVSLTNLGPFEALKLCNANSDRKPRAPKPTPTPKTVEIQAEVVRDPYHESDLRIQGSLRIGSDLGQRAANRTEPGL